ncbi:MAG TPA: transposase [Balneolaceae bacterium]
MVLYGLKIPVTQVVEEALHYRDSKKYDLYVYCLMPNHVHLVFQHLNNASSSKSFPITEIMKGLKRYTALKCNKTLGRKGAFWQSESYDRVIRNQDELEKTIRYTLNNPIKAGLVNYWQEWPYNYCKPEFKESFM